MIDRKSSPKDPRLDAVSTVETPESGVVPGPARALSGGPPELPGRYEDLGAVARGAFGEVRRVRDTAFDRVLAMKVLHAEVAAIPSMRRRFFAEVQITAQLQHPGVVPVYDHGELRDGRLFYTMKEVRGATLGAVIAELHAAAEPGAFATTASGWTFRRVVDAFARIALTVAYAHSRGVMHRDLKPENLMIGELGEVLVMDWGLARRVAHEDGDGDAGADVSLGFSDDAASAALTRHGDVLGTPAYMSPEQVRGARELHGPHSDVYALGAILYHLLAGRPPYAGGRLAAARRSLEEPPPPLDEGARGGPKIPAELARACDRAMQRDIADRCTAEVLAADILAWLDGVRRREQALAVLDEARALAPEIAREQAQAGRAEAEARSLLGALRPFDPVPAKRAAWAIEDEARRRALAAALAEAKWLMAVHGALSVDPDLPDAHAMLADHYRAALVEAERAHREKDAARFEEMLRVHDRGQHASFLRGDGALTLLTDPPGAEVTLHRYALEDRRLVPVFERALGATPLRGVPVQRGSYLLLMRAPGRAEVRYPIAIERDGHWDGVAPGEREPQPIALPGPGELGPDDIYVPAGWSFIGGDPAAPDSLLGRRIWVDAFVMRRYPVTNSEYLVFLNDLAAQGREAEVLAASPYMEMGRVEGSEERLAWARDERGRFELPKDGADPAWSAGAPVVQVDWHAASAFARWLSERTGQPWRLPNELEREKAARGADGRIFPWGDHGDPTFACVLEGHQGEPAREQVEGHPADESPYGVRGLAGNVRDWCINVWKHEGPLVLRDRLCIDPAEPSDPEFRAIRGGFWGGPMVNSRSAGRFGSRPGLRRFSVGVRVVRSFPDRR